MEFKELIKIFRGRKNVIFGATFLVMILSLLFHLLQPPRYAIYLNAETKRINRPATAEYQYDEYYAIEAANFVTETIDSWFRSKNFIDQILSEADFLQPSLLGGREFFQTKKLSAQNLEIIVTTDDQGTAEKLAKIVKREMQVKVSNLNLNQDEQPTFRTDIEIGTPQVNQASTLYVILASFCGGLILGILLVLILHYFALPKTSPR